MGFVTEVRMLANLFNSKKAIMEIVDEYEKDCKRIKERIINLRGNITIEEDNFQNLSKLESDLRQEATSLSEEIERLRKNINEEKDEIRFMHELESVEFLKEFVDKRGCEIKHLEISGLNCDWKNGGYCYSKDEILRKINLYIQEFAAKECVSYTKLKRAIYDINPAWFELFEKANSFIYTNTNTTNTILTTFLVPVKDSKKKL